jgi:hypothetical protein
MSPRRPVPSQPATGIEAYVRSDPERMEVNEPAALTFPVPRRDPAPPRPTPATFDLTPAGHVVAPPRTEAQERRDPPRLITCSGWPA